MARTVEPYLVGADTVKSVALHYSQRTLDFYGRGDPDRYLQSFHGAYKALLASHIPFDIVIDEHITDGRVRDYDLCVLSNSACTSDAVNEGLLSYVESGGSLLATYKTSLYDQSGHQRDDFGLQEAFGASYYLDFEPAYMSVDSSLAAGLTGSPMIQHHLVRAQAAPGSQVLGSLIAPSPTDLAPFTYVSAPTEETPWPSLVRKGQVVYCAADIGYTFLRAGYPDHVRLIANIVQALVADRIPLRIRAPSTLDVAFAHQEGRYLVHLVNMTTDQVIEDQNCNADTYEVIPLHEIEIRVKLGQRVRRVCRASDEMELPWHREGDWVVIEYPRLDLYDIAVLEL